MTIEIKVSGNDAAETVAQFLGLAGYLGASVQLPVAVAGVAAVTTPQVLTTTLSADADDADEAALPVAAGTVDAEGLPFDDRIHAKAVVPFKADGTWKRRKNISDELYNSVRAELKARAAASGAPAAVETPAPAPVVDVAVVAPVVETPPPPAPAPVIAEPLAITNTVADVPPAPAPVAAPAPAPAPRAPAPVTGKTHADLTGALTKVLSAVNSALPGKAAPLLMGLMASYGEGVKSVAQVPADKIDECYNLMQRMAADPVNAEAISAGLM